MCKIKQDDYEQLVPGMIVRITPKLRGQELYDFADPEDYKKWCGKEVTVADVYRSSVWMIKIEEEEDVSFLLEEIECIVEDEDILESDEQINVLLGVIV